MSFRIPLWLQFVAFWRVWSDLTSNVKYTGKGVSSCCWLPDQSKGRLSFIAPRVSSTHSLVVLVITDAAVTMHRVNGTAEQSIPSASEKVARPGIN